MTIADFSENPFLRMAGSGAADEQIAGLSLKDLFPNAPSDIPRERIKPRYVAPGEKLKLKELFPLRPFAPYAIPGSVESEFNRRLPPANMVNLPYKPEQRMAGMFMPLDFESL